MYCYINLRFIENGNSDPDDFLLSVDDDNDEEEADANNEQAAEVGVAHQNGEVMVQMEDTNDLLMIDE